MKNNFHEKIGVRETVDKPELDPPAIESLTDPLKAVKAWPDLADNPSFLQQIATRKLLNDRLSVLDRLPTPDTDIETAIGQGQISENEAVSLYESLTHLLAQEDYKRVALYLPFEILSHEEWQPELPRLKVAVESFRLTYMKAWHDLLLAHDVRANFVDGDVLEVDQRTRDLPRVVKAAHLIPKLVQHGLFSVNETIELIEKNENPILKNSLADTLPVLADLGFIKGSEIEDMEKSVDRAVRAMAKIIKAQISTQEAESEPTVEVTSPESIKERLGLELQKIGRAQIDGVTEKRAHWLLSQANQQAVEKAGKGIAQLIIKSKFSERDIDTVLAKDATIEDKKAFVLGVLEATERTAAAAPQGAPVIFTKFKKAYEALWSDNNPDLKAELTRSYWHLYRLGLISDARMAELAPTKPALAGPYSKNIPLMAEEIKDVQSAIKAIESSPELSRLIYPVVLLYGSKLKGYGKPDADIDLAIFVKPVATPADQATLDDLLDKILPNEKFKDGATQFWLEEQDGQLKVKDFPANNSYAGESYWTHVLFGAVWEGSKAVIDELRSKLLTPYLYDTDKTIHGRNARELYIEELERDTLQYRLMHNGYDRFYPPAGGIKSPHADEIDGQSKFWDSGYRRLATKLYANRVFLPKISDKE